MQEPWPRTVNRPDRSVPLRPSTLHAPTRPPRWHRARRPLSGSGHAHRCGGSSSASPSGAARTTHGSRRARSSRCRPRRQRSNRRASRSRRSRTSATRWRNWARHHAPPWRRSSWATRSQSVQTHGSRRPPPCTVCASPPSTHASVDRPARASPRCVSRGNPSGHRRRRARHERSGGTCECGRRVAPGSARDAVGDRRLIWVNVRCGPEVSVGVEACAHMNAALAAAALQYDVELADWDAWSSVRGIDPLVDGVHYDAAAYPRARRLLRGGRRADHLSSAQRHALERRRRLRRPAGATCGTR